jgi:hypothetical protein
MMAVKLKNYGSDVPFLKEEWSRLALTLYKWASVKMTPQIK